MPARDSSVAPRPAVAATQVITTVAGTGTAGYNGDAQPATSAQLHHPRGVAVDGAGNLFIADGNNHRIRRVDHATQQISTVAGTGVAGWSGDTGPGSAAQLHTPFDVALQADGDLYIADTGNHRVRRLASSNGNIFGVAGNGTGGYSGDGAGAGLAALNSPRNLGFDEDEHL